MSRFWTLIAIPFCITAAPECLAFKPDTHVLVAQEVINEATLKNGWLTFDFKDGKKVDIKVPAQVFQAIWDP